MSRLRLVKITTTKPLKQNNMKSKIADWIHKFWYNNHTHFWIVFTPEMDREKCMWCNQLRQNVEWREEMIKKEQTFKNK